MDANVKVASNAEFFVCNASIVGNKNRVWGHRNVVTGNGNQVYGNWNCVTGNKNTVKGINNRVAGLKNDIVDAGTLSASSSSSTTPSCGSYSSASSADSTPSDVGSGGNGNEEAEEDVWRSFPSSDAAAASADAPVAAEVLLVSVCKRVRVRTDASGRRSCENFRVELVERRRVESPAPASMPASTGGGLRRCYDLSGLDGADSEASGLPCSVCLSRERCVKLSPCRHVPVCMACTRRLFEGATARSVRCPLCRSPVEAVERLFLN